MNLVKKLVVASGTAAMLTGGVGVAAASAAVTSPVPVPPHPVGFCVPQVVTVQDDFGVLTTASNVSPGEQLETEGFGPHHTYTVEQVGYGHDLTGPLHGHYRFGPETITLRGFPSLSRYGRSTIRLVTVCQPGRPGKPYHV